MQDNIDEFNLAIYASIVPGLASPINRIKLAATYQSEKEIKYMISCINGQPGQSSIEDENSKPILLVYFRENIVFINNVNARRKKRT